KPERGRIKLDWRVELVKWSSLLLACLTAIAAPCVLGQATQGAGSGPAASSATTAGSLEPTQADQPDSGQDGNDLGRQVLLDRRERPRMFQVTSDTQYLYDSNVLLTDGDFIQEEADAVFIQTFGVSFSPPFLSRLRSTLYWQHDLVRYDDLSKFDFD